MILITKISIENIAVAMESAGQYASVMVPPLESIPVASVDEVAISSCSPNIVSITKVRMALAARMLMSDYENNSELTAFTVLDGDDFHEQR